MSKRLRRESYGGRTFPGHKPWAPGPLGPSYSGNVASVVELSKEKKGDFTRAHLVAAPVPPISQPAERGQALSRRRFHGPQVRKLAIQQTGKSAVPGAVRYARITTAAPRHRVWNGKTGIF